MEKHHTDQNINRPVVCKHISRPDETFANNYKQLQFDSLCVDYILALNPAKFKSYSKYRLQLYEKGDNNDKVTNVSVVTKLPPHCENSKRPTDLTKPVT